MPFIDLPYIARLQKYQLFSWLLEEPWAMLLDSGCKSVNTTNLKQSSYQRYDILVARPTVSLTFDHGKLVLQPETSLNSSIMAKFPNQQPLQIMRELLNAFAKKSPISSTLCQPFNGGWVGYLSYDFAKQLQPVQQRLKSANHTATDHSQDTAKQSSDSEQQLPEIQMGLYQWALITDHQQTTSRLVNFGLLDDHWNALKNEIRDCLSGVADDHHEHKLPSIVLKKPFQSNLSYQDYSSSFKRIQDYIRAGDCYQVNFAQQFSAEFEGKPLEIYKILAEKNNAPFSAFLNFDQQQILCLSPERFIESNKGKVTTQPIKGTLPRNADPEVDKALAKQLINSEKDRAENLMIVDLLRNDLSKTAAKSSVKVTEIFAHYQFEAVHHLISTVTSRLADGFDNFDLLATTLPGGSITGAPKIRAMQIIDELEKSKRSIYCGIIGYIDFIGNMDTNICIRTLLIEQDKIYTWAGGGLVINSKLESEYQETLDKLNKIIPELNQFAKHPQ